MPRREELRLARAKAMAWADLTPQQRAPIVNADGLWESIVDESQQGYLDMARAIERADAALDVVSVPMVATLDMIDAGWEQVVGAPPDQTEAIWSAMLAASPLAPEEPE